MSFKFSTDGEGNYGYLGADDSFIPFKSGGTIRVVHTLSKSGDWNSVHTINVYFNNKLIGTQSKTYQYNYWQDNLGVLTDKTYKV